MDDYTLPRGYVERKLALRVRLDALDENEGAYCARGIWDLLLEIERELGTTAQAAKDARDLLKRLVDAVEAIQRAARLPQR